MGFSFSIHQVSNWPLSPFVYFTCEFLLLIGVSVADLTSLTIFQDISPNSYLFQLNSKCLQTPQPG